MQAISQQLEVAQQLQRGLIPESIPQARPFHIGALSMPADTVGGDFYDFIPRESGAFDFVLGDVTGHGLSAALVVALSQATFREGVEKEIELPNLLDYSDRTLKNRLRRRLFVAANYGHVVPENQQVHLFNAGQQSFLFKAKSGCLEEISVEGSTYPLGIIGRGGYMHRSFTLEQGDMMVCSSDGIPEALNRQEEEFGFKRLDSAVREVAEGEPDEIVNHVFQQVADFTEGCEQNDDLTLLVVKADSEFQDHTVSGADRMLLGERRPVSLMCMQLTSEDEPVPFSELLWKKVQQTVAQYDGVVDRLSTDTVVTCFGLPVLHEDDPERAIMAARDIEQLIHEHRLISHCGLHIGSVITRSDGSLDYSLMGSTLAETLGLLDEAKPGHSNLSTEAYQRLEGRVRLRAVEEVHYERCIYAVPSLEKVQLTHRYGKKTDRIYVGRQTELRRLHQAWRRAVTRQGPPTIITIVGEAGLGKSSLAEEFLRRKGSPLVLRGQSRAFPPESAGLFSSMLRQWLMVEEGELAKTAHRLGEKVSSLRDRRFGMSLPYLQALIGYRDDLPKSLDPKKYQTEVASAVRLLIEVLANQSDENDPLVLVLEDLHWMDSVSAMILTSLIQELRTENGVLILALSRPQEKSLLVFKDTRRHTPIVLQPLTHREVELWLKRVLKGARIPEEVLQTLRMQGEGHPLFLEELVSHLREQNILYRERGTWELRSTAEWSTPQNLNGLILSRVVRLDERVRQVLQQASVIGQEFSVDLLTAMNEEVEKEEYVLGGLNRLIEDRFIVTGGDNKSYTFRHALVRKAVHDSLLADDRSWLHARVAQSLEKTYPKQVEKFAQRLTEHYYHARRLVPALKYLMIALKQCVDEFSYQEGLLLVERGKELVAQQDDSRAAFEVLKYQQTLLALQGDLINQRLALDQMEQIALGLDDVGLLGEVFLLRARLAYETLTPTEELLTTAEEALKYTRRARDRAGEARARSLLGSAYYRLGNYNESIVYYEKAQKLFQEIGDLGGEMECLAGIANNYDLKGQYNIGMEKRKQVVSHLRELDDRKRLVIQLGNLGESLMKLGHFEEALSVLKEGAIISEEIGYNWAWAFILFTTIEARLMIDDCAGAWEIIEKHCSLLSSQDLYPTYQLSMARYFATQDDQDILKQGKKCANKAIRASGQNSAFYQESNAWNTRSKIALKMGQVNEAFMCSQKALERFHQQPLYKELLVDILFTRFQSFKILGRQQEAWQALTEAFGILKNLARNIENQDIKRFWLVPLYQQVVEATQNASMGEDA